MSLRLDAQAAEELLRMAASAHGEVDAGWAARVETLSQLCESGAAKTHIAFLGTSMLAKALDVRADLRAIKPRLDPTNPNAYSARSLCHGVLVPLSAELGFSLGVTGREPLNNQPYFRMSRLGDDTPVHPGSRSAFDFMIQLINELHYATSSTALEALRAFISVRRGYQRSYGAAEPITLMEPRLLLDAVKTLVAANSEGGRRAQAAVAGLLDVFAGTGRIESGRVNDPSRHFPGDVAVLADDVAEGGIARFEKAFEVRDKPVRFSDVALFGRTCIERGVREAAMVLVSDDQGSLDAEESRRWSEELGLSMTLFFGWAPFVEGCLFWASPPQPEAAALAAESIRSRLIEVEASPEAIETWDRLTRRSG